MEPFTTHTGVAAPLPRSNVDTDQIIPAVYLKRVTRTGFEDGLFAAWRKDPEFVLNDPAYSHASVLVTGPDFGTGSSREHAVWALQNYGFAVIIGSRFGDIFQGNAGKAGLLVAVIPAEEVTRLWQHLAEHRGVELTVDLATKLITSAEGFETGFDIDDYTRWRLSEGLDDIGLTFRHLSDIDDFEPTRPSYAPTTLPGRTT